MSGIQMEVRYSNGGLNTGLNLVRYSNGIQITEHSAIGQLSTIQIPTVQVRVDKYFFILLFFFILTF